MDFTLSPEQLLIKDSVARFAAGAHAGTEKWPQFAELGWLAIGAPDELGGFGGPIETLLLMEQFGRGLVASPYVAQVVLAGHDSALRGAHRAAGTARRRHGTIRRRVRGAARALRSGCGRKRRAVRDGDAYVLTRQEGARARRVDGEHARSCRRAPATRSRSSPCRRMRRISRASRMRQKTATTSRTCGSTACASTRRSSSARSAAASRCWIARSITRRRRCARKGSG